MEKQPLHKTSKCLSFTKHSRFSSLTYLPNPLLFHQSLGTAHHPQEQCLHGMPQTQSTSRHLFQLNCESHFLLYHAWKKFRYCVPLATVNNTASACSSMSNTFPSFAFTAVVRFYKRNTKLSTQVMAPKIPLVHLPA